MYYTIYKVTNKINGKLYIGSHKTNNLDDKYMGSGKYLKYAQEKYGLENFIKEILFVFDNPEQMYAKEAEIVTEEFIAEENTYNIKVGGFGGFDYINNHPEKYLTQKRLEALANNNQKGSAGWKFKYTTDNEFKNRCLANLAKATKRHRELYPEGAFKGKVHTADTKQRISAKAKQRLLDPTKNSQYGTMWITNGSLNKKIKKNECLPQGWQKGRKT